MLEANLTPYVFFWVGCLYYLLPSFLCGLTSVCASVSHHGREKYLGFLFCFFFAQCVLACLLFPYPCLCLRTSAQVVCSRKYDTRKRTRSNGTDACHHGNTSRCQQNRVQGWRPSIVCFLSSRVQSVTIKPQKATICMKQELFLGKKEGGALSFDVFAFSSRVKT